MSPYRVAAVVLVIGAGLVGSYLIIKNSIPAVPAGQAEGPVTAPKPLAQNPVKWIEEAAEFLNEPAKNLANSSSFLAENGGQGGSGNTESTSSVNLTKLVAQSLFGQMQKSDQNEQNPFEGKGFDPQSPEGQKMIQEAIANLKNSSLFPNQSVRDSDLKISSDNSSKVKSEYLITTGGIIVDNSNEVYKNPVKALEKLVNNSDASEVAQLADTYAKIYNGFVNTPVPSNWLDLHKRYVTFLKNTESVYRAIADFQNDPVKSQLFTQLVPEVAKIELSIKQEYYQKSLNLNS